MSIHTFLLPSPPGTLSRHFIHQAFAPRQTPHGHFSHMKIPGHSPLTVSPICQQSITAHGLLVCYRTVTVLDWIEQGLTSHSTHFRLFWRRWGDCVISQDCSHGQSPQCVVLSSVCATTVDNTGVYVCYLKSTVSICFRCPARSVGFSETDLYLCTYNQPS